MRTQGQARFTGHIVRDAIEKERPMATSKAPEFPHSTCVECGRKMPAGTVQRCSMTQGGFCSWRVPAAVREHMDGLVPNDVAVPKWNPISVIFVVGLCELALVAGFYLAWRAWR